MLKATVNIARELKNPGKLAHAELSTVSENLYVCGRQLVTEGQIHVQADYSYDGEGGVNMAGKISAVFREECSRCGREFLRPFECEFSEFFVRVRSDIDIVSEDTGFTFTEDVLDLSDLINETVMLNYPMTSLCSENCKGLCPVCGCDLNTDECTCGMEPEQEEIDFDSEDAFEKAVELLKSRYSVNK
ncbi:MAG: DUF177 domain-containing protein [Clostridia bacterium]|nr:DUF177 domain-containing protein [Clostridia bacterium]